MKRSHTLRVERDQERIIEALRAQAEREHKGPISVGGPARVVNQPGPLELRVT